MFINVFLTKNTQFQLNNLSVYAQDEIQVSDKLRISPGLRFDLTSVPNTPALSATTRATALGLNAGKTYTATPLSQISNSIFGQVLISLRVGFNYDVKCDKLLIIRGGRGVFTGKISFAWLG